MSAEKRQAPRRTGSYQPRSDNYLFMVLIAVVVFPTPPFWFAIAMTCAIQVLRR